MKTVKVNISLTQEAKEKGKKDSEKLFGKENLSGYINHLIIKADGDTRPIPKKK